MPIEVELPDGTIAEFPDGTSAGTMEMALAKYRAPKTAPQAMERGSSTEGMSFGDKLAAGFGASFVDAGRGIKQAATLNAKRISGAIEGLHSAVGTSGLTRQIPQAINSYLSDSLQGQQGRIDEARRIDQPLNETGAGRVGQGLGYLTQLLTPGVLARGSAVGSVLLPRTVAGMSAQGGALGYLQPTAQGDSRAANTAIGVGAGAAGGAIAPVVGAAVRGIGRVAQPLFTAGRDRMVANALQQMADNPSALTAARPSNIPGVQRTLAEESLDPGIARLERNMRATNTSQFVPLDRSNNQARANAVRATFEGADEQAARQIEGARDAVATRQLRGLRSAGFVEKKPVQAAMEAAIKRHQGNPATQKALMEAASEIPEFKTAQQAYNFRKYIDSLMAGTSDKPAAKAARKELVGVKAVLDRSIRKAYPDWGNYLADFSGQSRRAEQSRAGARILDAGRATPDAVSGEVMLTPAQVSRIAQNPDALVRQASGFRRATADRSLTQPQIGLLGDLQNDMSAVAFAQDAGRGVGSNTFENFANRGLLSQVLGNAAPGANRISGGLLGSIDSLTQKTYSVLGVPERLNSRMAEVLANPQAARQLLAKLPKSDRRIIERALSRTGGRLGIVGAAVDE